MSCSNVVWDWNGTLLDDLETGIRTLDDMLERRGLQPLSLTEYKETFGFPVVDFYRKTGFDLEQEDLEGLSVDFVDTYERFSGTLHLNEGAVPVLERLEKSGVRQYVLSALREDLLLGMLEDFGIRPFFAGVCGSDNIYGTGKIDRGRRMLETYGMEPSATVMVGDTVHDAEVAEALGFGTLLYAGGHNSERRLRERAGTVRRLEDIPDRLL